MNTSKTVKLLGSGPGKRVKVTDISTGRSWLVPDYSGDIYEPPMSRIKRIMLVSVIVAAVVLVVVMVLVAVS